jgi:hypothetical protein
MAVRFHLHCRSVVFYQLSLSLQSQDNRLSEIYHFAFYMGELVPSKPIAVVDCLEPVLVASQCLVIGTCCTQENSFSRSGSLDVCRFANRSSLDGLGRPCLS